MLAPLKPLRFRRGPHLRGPRLGCRSSYRHAAAYEIIVVDDDVNGSAETVAIDCARKAARMGPAIRYIPANGQGPAAARNIGWRSARGAIVAFTDDDCIPEPGWVEAGLRALSGTSNGAAAGNTVVPMGSTPSDYERNTKLMEQASFVTANCFCTRDALERVGGFDEAFAVAWREDSDLFFRFLGSRITVSAASDAVVIHPVRPPAWGASLHQQRKSEYNALLYKKHPGLYRQIVQPHPPWHYYAIVGSALLGLGWIGTALWASTSQAERRSRMLSLVRSFGQIAAGVWWALTIGFFWTRIRKARLDRSQVSDLLVTSVMIPFAAVYWRLKGAVRFRVWFL